MPVKSLIALLFAIVLPLASPLGASAAARPVDRDAGISSPHDAAAHLSGSTAERGNLEEVERSWEQTRTRWLFVRASVLPTIVATGVERARACPPRHRASYPSRRALTRPRGGTGDDQPS